MMQTVGSGAVLVLALLSSAAAAQEAAAIRLFSPAPPGRVASLQEFKPAPDGDIRDAVREGDAAALMLGTDARWENSPLLSPEDTSVREAPWQVAAQGAVSLVATAAPTSLSERTWQVAPSTMSATSAH